MRWHPKLQGRQFLVRAGIALLITLGVLFYTADRFRLGIDDQVVKCLDPPRTWFIVDTAEQDLRRGQLIAFAANDLMQPWFQPGQRIIKRVAGGPGDRIEIVDKQVRVNGAVVATGLALAGTMGTDPERFARETFTLGDEELWVMGDTTLSFDSRYWGVLKRNQVIGRAYALF